MKNRRIYTLIIALILYMLLSTTAYANSSWHWLTKTPLDILPYAAVLTLLIEYVTIKKLNSIIHPFMLLLIICLANMASFLLPYATLLMPSDVGYTFEMSIKHLPIYIVGFGYLFLTLAAEVPIVYISLRNIVTNRKKLLISIITVNVVTTIMVAAIERIFCRGSW